MNAFDTKVYHLINGLSGHIRWLDATLGFIAHFGLEIYMANVHHCLADIAALQTR